MTKQAIMATNSNFTVVMHGNSAFNRFGDVELKTNEAIDGLVDGKPSTRKVITLPKGAFGAYLRTNIPGYSAKCQSLAEDKNRGTALIKRLFTVAIKDATINITAHQHKANDAVDGSDFVYTKDGYHYTIESIENIPEKVYTCCKPYAEERERQAVEAKRQEEENSYQQITQNLLKSCVNNWSPLDSSNTLKYNYLLQYYPTTCKIDANRTIWNDRYTVWNFKNTPGKTTPLQHQQALNYIIPRITTILKQTFGSKLSDITLFCIPASSEEKNKNRYEEFSAILCNDTGMHNAFPHIFIQGERGAKHEGESGGNQRIELEAVFLGGKIFYYLMM